jgi:hypothetical protein
MTSTSILSLDVTNADISRPPSHEASCSRFRVKNCVILIGLKLAYLLLSVFMAAKVGSGWISTSMSET